MRIRVGECCSFPRQEGGQHLEPHGLLIPIAIGAPLNHANLVIQALDDAELDLVAGRAIRRDARPVPFDQGGKFLEGPEPLPFELLLPANNKLASPARAAIGPELSELLLEQVGRGPALGGPQQLPERPAARQCEIGPMGEQRVALALDEGAGLRRAPLILGAADLIHGVGQMTQDMELVEQNLGLRRMGLHRVAEGLPPIQHRQANASGLLRPQREQDPIQIGGGPSLPPTPDRAAALQVAAHNAIRMALLDRQLIHADDLWRWLGRLGPPRLHVPYGQILDRVRMQVQQLGHGLVRHVPTQGADVRGEPLRIAGIRCSQSSRSTVTPRQRAQATRRCSYATSMRQPAASVSRTRRIRRS